MDYNTRNQVEAIVADWIRDPASLLAGHFAEELCNEYSDCREETISIVLENLLIKKDETARHVAAEKIFKLFNPDTDTDSLLAKKLGAISKATKEFCDRVDSLSSEQTETSS